MNKTAEVIKIIEETTQFEYENAVDYFFKENYPIILAKFLEDNHDKFNEHVEEMYQDHEGQEAKWIWKPSVINPSIKGESK